MLYKEVGREVERAREAKITNQYLDDKPINHKNHRKNKCKHKTNKQTNRKQKRPGGGGGGGEKGVEALTAYSAVLRT